MSRYSCIFKIAHTKYYLYFLWTLHNHNQSFLMYMPLSFKQTQCKICYLFNNIFQMKIPVHNQWKTLKYLYYISVPCTYYIYICVCNTYMKFYFFTWYWCETILVMKYHEAPKTLNLTLRKMVSFKTKNNNLSQQITA